jgi:hypothetical protein
MDWIDLAQNRDEWRALVNTVMNLRFHKLLRNSLPILYLNTFNKTFLDSRRHCRKRCSWPDFFNTLFPVVHELPYECASSRMLLWSM